MSTLAQLVTDGLAAHTALTTQTATAATATAHTAVPLAGGGIIDTATNLNSSTQTLLRAGSITVAVLFVIMAAIKSRGAAAAVIISGAVAAVFCYIVFNVTDLQNKVTTDINGGLGPAISAPPTPGPASGTGTGQVNDR